MNVLLINNQARPEVSGVARHFENIARELIDLGHTVIRLVAKDQLFNPKKDRVEYRYFQYLNKEGILSESVNQQRVKKNRRAFKDSLRQMNWKKIDLVITGNDIYVAALKELIDPQKIIAIIPSSLTFSKKSNPDRCQKVIDRMKTNLKDIKTVVLSKKMQSMIVALVGKGYNIQVVYPGVNAKRFSRVSTEKINIDLLYLGRIAKEKNIEMMIQALAQVKNPYNLTLVGTGDEVEVKKIKQLAKDVLPNRKISFLGKRKLVEKYYRRSKIFLLPSRYEAFGLVILEAMASGLPVIAFRPNKEFLTASDEIISDGSDGFLVNDVTELAQKVDLLLSNSPLLDKMSQKAIQKAHSFNWQDHVRKLISL